MSVVQPTPERNITSDTLSPVAPTPRPRVLACSLCQKRKVKCDRNIPCSNCVKSRAECVPATVAPRRPRRRHKQDLLERLRRCEDLLQENNIKFEPLQKGLATEDPSPHPDCSYGSDDDQNPDATETNSPSPSTAVKSEGVDYEAKNFWFTTMNHRFRGDVDDESDISYDNNHTTVIKNAWEQLSGNKIFLLLGSRKSAAPLSSLHPEPVSIFRFWQIYLDNVNPLFKVIHAPSLQGRIIEAISNLGNVHPALEALMFSIYCVAIVSSSADDCQEMFGSQKEDLLTKYQSGCQQALLNAGFLRTNDRECLTALYLYLISVGPGTDPISLSGLLGVAFRIARRLGIHSESAHAKYTPFEAEMRRRLWWSFITFDARICEMADHKSVSLDPTWDCKIPLNVNDSDLRPEMKQAPPAQGYCTDSIFAVVRSELGEFTRHSKFHLDFTNPALKPLARDIQHGTTSEVSAVAVLEKMIEDKYLKFCDSGIPLHYMTLWMTRCHLARYRLIEQYSKLDRSPNPSAHRIDEELDHAMPYAFKMLECDTKIMTSPLTRGYLWLANFHFQLPAYIHIAQELRRNPLSKHADQAWELMSDNFEGRFAHVTVWPNPLSKLFLITVLPAWEAREAKNKDSGEPLTPPRIVTYLHKLIQMTQNSHDGQTYATDSHPDDAQNIDNIDFSTAMPMSFGANLYGMGGQDDYSGIGAEAYPGILGQDPFNVDANQMNWSSMDWGLG
ncbi:hypothetical protein F4677DRAFT_464488 [Hypoxylon crocopeplum]|nr:hypothetical protein F4677DRAFT_464488 [Hypoxylon crocopeplum]